MTLAFQQNLLAYIAQEGSYELCRLMDKNLFALPEHQIVLQLMKAYYKNYKLSPSKRSLEQYIHLANKKQKLDDNVLKSIVAASDKLFEPLGKDYALTKDLVILEAKRKAIKKLLAEHAAEVPTMDSESMKAMSSKMQSIINISSDKFEFKYEGRYLLADRNKPKPDIGYGHPTCYEGLNNLMTRKGFLSPELIVIMSTPKGFKTGFLLNVMMGYVKAGLKVYLADTENGLSQLLSRLERNVLEATFEEYRTKEEQEELKYQLKVLAAHKGDIRIQQYAPHTATINDVSADIRELKTLDGFEPDVIMYDYLDNFKANGAKEYDKRINIQRVYFEAIALNVHLNTFAFSPSQTNRAGAQKEEIGSSDYAEDWGKAMNVHASLSINRTKLEVQAGVARMVPVDVREGKRHVGKDTTVYFTFDESRQKVKEISFESYNDLMQLAQEAQGAGNKVNSGTSKQGMEKMLNDMPLAGIPTKKKNKKKKNK